MGEPGEGKAAGTAAGQDPATVGGQGRGTVEGTGPQTLEGTGAGPAEGKWAGPVKGTVDSAAAAVTMAAAAKEKLPVTAAEYRSTAILLGFFVVTIVLAAFFGQPFQQAGLQVFEDTGSVLNPVWYILMVLAFTALILALAKWGKKWVIRAIILFAFGSTVAYVTFPVLALTFGVNEWIALSVAVGGAAATLLALYLHPEWYVVDFLGLLVAAASAALFGISFEPLPVVVLLALLAIYDAIAVYRTKHMLSLADSVMELQLPVLVVVPKHRSYRFRYEKAQFKTASAETKAKREAMFMGLGDLVMPTILVVASLAFLPHLTDLEKQTRITDADWTGPLTAEFTMASTTGHPATAEFFATSGAPGAASWTWSLDVEGDGKPEAQGTGLPARHVATFDRPVAYATKFHVANATHNGTFEAVVQTDYVHDDWRLGMRTLLANPPALGAAFGTLAGYLVLMAFVLRGNPQAGLPLLNGGAITGFLVGLYLATGSLRFW